jgi:hypothetical protein
LRRRLRLLCRFRLCRRRLIRGRGCLRALFFEQQDHGSLGHRVAGLELDLDDLAGARRGHVHRGLFSFEGDQRRFFFDVLTCFDQHVDDAHVLEAANVGHENFDGF